MSIWVDIDNYNINTQDCCLAMGNNTTAFHFAQAVESLQEPKWYMEETEGTPDDCVMKNGRTSKITMARSISLAPD